MEGKVFHPHGDKNGIHSSSIKKDADSTEVVSHDSGKKLTKVGDEKGMIFAHNGRMYDVVLDESMQTISVDERYQDKNNIWHTKKEGFFAQGEDAETIAKDSGGWFVNTIVDYLDGAGALQEINMRDR